MSTDPDMMGVAKSRHLSKTQIRWCGATPEDRWPVCKYALRHRPTRAQRAAGEPGDLKLNAAGEAQCWCKCIDRTAKHRWRHEDVEGKGTCFWCGKAL